MTWGLGFTIECDQCGVDYSWYADHPADEGFFIETVRWMGWRVDDDQNARSACPDCNPDWLPRPDEKAKP